VFCFLLYKRFFLKMRLQRTNFWKRYTFDPFFYFSASATGSVHAWRYVIKQEKDENGFVNFCLQNLYNKYTKGGKKNIRLTKSRLTLGKSVLRESFGLKLVATLRHFNLFRPVVRNRFNFRLWVAPLWSSYFNLELNKKAMRSFVDMPMPRFMNKSTCDDPVWFNFLRNQMFFGLWYSRRMKSHFFRMLQRELGFSNDIHVRGETRRYRGAKIFNTYESIFKELEFNKGVLVTLQDKHITFIPSNLPKFFTGKQARLKIGDFKKRKSSEIKKTKTKKTKTKKTKTKNIKTKKQKQKI